MVLLLQNLKQTKRGFTREERVEEQLWCSAKIESAFSHKKQHLPLGKAGEQAHSALSSVLVVAQQTVGEEELRQGGLRCRQHVIHHNVAVLLPATKLDKAGE